MDAKPIAGFFGSLRNLAIVTLVGLLIVAIVRIEINRRDVIDARLRADELVEVNDSTKARNALLERENGELRALIDAAKDLNGELIAGMTIVVPAETLYTEASPVDTEVRPDSSRFAVLEDSTQGYTVRIEAEAPPFPGELRLGYTIITPEFRPEVGFVERDGSYAAVVSWAGREFTIEDAFFDPPKPPSWSLVLGAEGDVIPVATGVIPAGRAYAGLQYRVSDRLEIQVNGGGWAVPTDDGYILQPFLGVSGERHIPLRWPF